MIKLLLYNAWGMYTLVYVMCAMLHTFKAVPFDA